MSYIVAPKTLFEASEEKLFFHSTKGQQWAHLRRDEDLRYPRQNSDFFPKSIERRSRQNA